MRGPCLSLFVVAAVIIGAWGGGARLSDDSNLKVFLTYHRVRTAEKTRSAGDRCHHVTRRNRTR